MSVTIKTISDDQVLVNTKEVYKDADGKWIAKQELTTSETQAFQQHIQN